MVYFVPLKRSFAQPQPMGCGLCAPPRRADRNNARDEAKNAVQASTERSCVLGRFAGRVSERPCCMDHPEGCLIMVFFNTGDNLDAT